MNSLDVTWCLWYVNHDISTPEFLSSLPVRRKSTVQSQTCLHNSLLTTNTYCKQMVGDYRWLCCHCRSVSLVYQQCVIVKLLTSSNISLISATRFTGRWKTRTNQSLIIKMCSLKFPLPASSISVGFHSIPEVSFWGYWLVAFSELAFSGYWFKVFWRFFSIVSLYYANEVLFLLCLPEIRLDSFDS